MTLITILYWVSLAALAGVALAARSRFSIGVLAVGAAFYGVIVLASGHPRHGIFMARSEARMIAYELRENQAIYVWLDGKEPTAWRLPWNEQLARKLHEGAREAAQTGQAMAFRGQSFGQGGEAFPMPVPPAPEKQFAERLP